MVYEIGLPTLKYCYIHAVTRTDLFSTAGDELLESRRGRAFGPPPGKECGSCQWSPNPLVRMWKLPAHYGSLPQLLQPAKDNTPDQWTSRASSMMIPWWKLFQSGFPVRWWMIKRSMQSSLSWIWTRLRTAGSTNLSSSWRLVPDGPSLRHLGSWMTSGRLGMNRWRKNRDFIFWLPPDTLALDFAETSAHENGTPLEKPCSFYSSHFWEKWMADFLTSSKGILSSISSKISVSEIGASTPPVVWENILDFCSLKPNGTWTGYVQTNPNV